MDNHDAAVSVAEFVADAIGAALAGWLATRLGESFWTGVLAYVALGFCIGLRVRREAR